MMIDLRGRGGACRRRTAVVVFAALMTVAGCTAQGDSSMSSSTPALPSRSVITQTVTESRAPTTKPVTRKAPARTKAASSSEFGSSYRVPNFVGMDLAQAQLLPINAGFTNLAVVDASGQGRSVDDGDNWTVCRQTPKPGKVARATTPRLTMYARHTSEGC